MSLVPHRYPNVERASFRPSRVIFSVGPRSTTTGQTASLALAEHCAKCCNVHGRPWPFHTAASYSIFQRTFPKLRGARNPCRSPQTWRSPCYASSTSKSIRQLLVAGLVGTVLSVCRFCFTCGACCSRCSTSRRLPSSVARPWSPFLYAQSKITSSNLTPKLYYFI